MVLKFPSSPFFPKIVWAFLDLPQCGKGVVKDSHKPVVFLQQSLKAEGSKLFAGLWVLLCLELFGRVCLVCSMGSLLSYTSLTDPRGLLCGTGSWPAGHQLRQILAILLGAALCICLCWSSVSPCQQCSAAFWISSWTSSLPCGVSPSPSSEWAVDWQGMCLVPLFRQ